MKGISRGRIFLLTLFFLIISYMFWGPLFPWNPIKIGFKKIESSMATVFITEYKGEDVVYKLDDILMEEESFHGLEFKKKFKIIILEKESNMRRYLPWIRGSGYSVKLGSMNVIYIGSNARNSPYGIDVFLKHEISHLLIHQNTPPGSNNMEILKQAWLAEGIATYFGGLHYYEKPEFIELWKENGLKFNNLYVENPHDMDRNIIRLKYTYYRFFIEFLVEEYGLERFQAYLMSYVNDPENYMNIFPEVYAVDFHEILEIFDAYMNPLVFY